MKNLLKNVNYQKYYKELLPYLKQEKSQQYFTLILTFGAAIFFALFAISPTLSTIAKLQKEIKDSKIVDQKLSQKINSLSSLSQEYITVQNDISYVLDAIPQKPEAPTLVAQIQSIAKNSSINISSIEISPINFDSQQKGLNSAFTFNIAAQGTYQDLQTFLSDLTIMQRVISVDSISIAKGEADLGLQLNLKGIAYYKK
jgi:Tfp pilus assembly protein PilO